MVFLYELKEMDFNSFVDVDQFLLIFFNLFDVLQLNRIDFTSWGNYSWLQMGVIHFWWNRICWYKFYFVVGTNFKSLISINFLMMFLNRMVLILQFVVDYSLGAIRCIRCSGLIMSVFFCRCVSDIWNSRWLSLFTPICN